ncbi:hypothetical protein FPE01S_01_00900 [Flavihumibacter petaseus NBRC 106054]|uniref:BioF2-like acetyltransferase domain-containing protein n=2 Tax=Flavihumibacter TaxID=1004301 RepID=A0A0E9MUC2_9BACT|nr:hypothetical protein FPE01S_01_00900 [Flavihumibacter petaseus NBRC 106054]
MITGNIQYLHRAAIDTARWDAAITAAGNGTLYAESAWLDNFCPHWDALVEGDYEQVMPLPWRKKAGIQYLGYTPFIYAGGVFGNDLNADRLKAFLDAVPPKFRYWDFPLNNGNNYTLPEYPMLLRRNFILPLSPSYTDIEKNYRKQIHRNIHKAKGLRFVVDTAVEVEEVIRLASLRHFNDYFSVKDYNSFLKIYGVRQGEGRAKIYGIRTNQGNLMASAVFFFAAGRAYYLLVGNHPDGKTAGASHFLIDAFIRDHCAQPLVLDFEGSDIDGLAFFYSSFGAFAEYYPTIRLNRLPAWLRWLKP